mmetsp:Transcript_18624/g.34704  ORF Transcript_18624/g.34704 Transcript_18624/m.34704 type:complete len:355 (+) Transcript_18624:168-1232(+)|eukprot:CAMPEP_0178774998 /NCGR_PEP_ID=MMETSP0744-20121128/23948_1 /TAXON_ID=913974 /ORGANISM="Nitzschia punctata, Strain CCMP561" /LENGTH=354 /DNA_ID=CAMNT_0020431927 /DNA_START=822 /DNA_END=1886 /DNA_ORIENTATION=+
MKFTTVSLALLATSSLGGKFATAQNATASAPSDVAFAIYFSDSSCTQFAGLKPIIANDPATVLQALKDKDGNDVSCVESMACAFLPEGRTCEALGVSGEFTTVTIDIREDGDVYECDDSNPAAGQDECSVIDPTACMQSSTYNCHFKFVSLSTLKTNPNAFIPPSTGTSTIAGLEKYAYLTYYNDDSCSDVAGIRGFVSDNPYLLARVGEEQDYTCAEAMPCFLQEDGTVCESLDLTGEPASSVIQVDFDEVYECDSSNENVDEPVCAVIDPEDCKTSSVYSCHFHWMSAISFATDPAGLLNPGTRAPSAIMPTEPPTEPAVAPPTEAPSGAFQVSSTICTFAVLGMSLSVWAL